MKYVIILFIICLVSSNSYGQSEMAKIHLLEIKYKNLDTIIDNIWNAERMEDSSIQKTQDILIVYTYKYNDSIRIRIAILPLKDFPYFYQNQVKSKIYGFLDYNDIKIIVLGHTSKLLFTKTKYIYKYTIINKIKNKTKQIKGSIPPPPIPYDLTTWYYSFKNNTIKYLTKNYW